MKQVDVALLGLGNVGRAFARYIIENSDKASFVVRVRAVADRSGGTILKSGRELESLLARKESGLNISSVSASRIIRGGLAFIEALAHGRISTLVEALPTNLENGQPGLDLISTALGLGINVVTVDKGPLAHGLERLRRGAASAKLAFSGATGVAIPVELESQGVLEIRGVLNGTTNYVLTEMQERQVSFDQALACAQAAGIAEPNPALDLDGWDTACKILILARALMGSDSRLSDVSRIGIGPETDSLIRVAQSSGRIVRLVGRARIWKGIVRVSVAPKILAPDSPFFAVSGASKAAVFRTETRGELVVFGRSGRNAIAETILQDIERVSAGQ